MNSKFKLVLMILFVFILSCTNEIESTLFNMMSNKVEIDLKNFIIIGNDHNQNVYGCNKKGFDMIIYYDSLECMSCMVNKLHQWNGLMKKVKYNSNNVRFLFIFEPKLSEIQNLSVSLTLKEFNEPVYIDTTHTFSKKNPFIPNDSRYHVFLVDSTSKIQLVGDPRNSKKLNTLFFNLINSRKKTLANKMHKAKKGQISLSRKTSLQ